MATRLALIVGINYDGANRLRNPISDATAVAARLRELGFIVLGGGALTDLDRAGMIRAVEDFGRAIERAGHDADILFYFSGHGLQVGGVNYLVPMGAQAFGPEDVADVYVGIDQVVVAMKSRDAAAAERAAAGCNFIILDACRSTPFARWAPDGLAPIHALPNTFIAFATAPGLVAYDGGGSHSPYTAALLDSLAEPAWNEAEVFRNVNSRVSALGKQVPWTQNSLGRSFVFNQGRPDTDPHQEQDPVKPPSDALIVWPGQPGCFDTIMEAVEAAPPGGVVVLKPGRYTESIVIEKPLTIRGSDDDLHAADVQWFPKGSRSALTVQDVGRGAMRLENLQFAVSVDRFAQGLQTMLDFVASDVTLAGCTLSAFPETATDFEGSARFAQDDPPQRTPISIGISVSGGSVTIGSRSGVSGFYAGVRAAAQADVVVEGQISHCRVGAFACVGARLTFSTGSRVEGSSECALMADGKGTEIRLLPDCEIIDNEMIGKALAGGRLHVAESRIAMNARGSFAVLATGGGSHVAIEGAQLIVAESGIAVADGARVILSDARLEQHNGGGNGELCVGLKIFADGEATLEGAVAIRGFTAGIEAEPGSTVIGQGYSIEACKVGLEVQAGTRFSARDIRVSDCTDNGIDLFGDAVLEKAEIWQCGAFGLCIGGDVRVSEARISRCKGGIGIREGTPEVENSLVFNNGAGLLVDSGAPRFENVAVIRNGGESDQGIFVEGGAEPVFDGCTISFNRMCGIQLSKGRGIGSLRASQVVENRCIDGLLMNIRGADYRLRNEGSDTSSFDDHVPLHSNDLAYIGKSNERTRSQTYYASSQSFTRELQTILGRVFRNNGWGVPEKDILVKRNTTICYKMEKQSQESVPMIPRTLLGNLAGGWSNFSKLELTQMVQLYDFRAELTVSDGQKLPIPSSLRPFRVSLTITETIAPGKLNRGFEPPSLLRILDNEFDRFFAELGFALSGRENDDAY